MAPEALTDLSRTNQIRLGQLASPAARCLLAALALAVSTGPLIRKLLAIALSDVITFFVGLLWLLGDLIPSLALIILFHDILIARRVDKSETFRIRCYKVSLLDFITILFIVLYAIDFVISLLNYFDRNHEKQLATFRYAFFHLQILLAILYVIKPWRWTEIDLREIVASFVRFYSLAHRVALGLSRCLERSPQAVIDPGRDYCVTTDESSLSTRFIANESAQPVYSGFGGQQNGATSREAADDNVDRLAMKRVGIAIKSATTSPPRGRTVRTCDDDDDHDDDDDDDTTRATISESEPKRKSLLRGGRVNVGMAKSVTRASATRAGSGSRGRRKRQARRVATIARRARSGGSARQMVLMCQGGCGARASTSRSRSKSKPKPKPKPRSKSKSLKGLKYICSNDSARTVNLNLNMN